MTTPETIYCSNPNHTRQVPAAAQLTWPHGPFKPATACMADLYNHISTARAEGDALNIELFPSTK